MDLSWQALAACRNEDPELFFPEGTGKGAQLQAQKALAVCHRCPVENACRNWALNQVRLHYGIVAGLQEDPRSKLNRATPIRNNPPTGRKRRAPARKVAS